ncbi:MAG: HlyD family efflux transporter periplasmic adaptor subunit [Planctomycetaceae bacterium]|nr:HlyD family efflux transporter periplasmic adaptor subunit [Planctomycetaceae bacterium]
MSSINSVSSFDSSISSSSSASSSSVEQTKVRIRYLLGEIAQLSSLDIPPDEYHAEFLNRVVSAMGSVGGAIWAFDAGTLALAYQVNFHSVGFQGDADANSRHARLLYRMTQSSGAGTLVPPHSGFEGDEESGNPTDWVLVFCPIRTELEVVGLVEILQRPDSDPMIQRGFAKFLAQTCALANDYYKNRQLRNFGERQNLWTLLEDFTRSIHLSLDVNETAYTVANEGRRLIECDRVSVALRVGGRCRIVAVSGQDIVDKRSTAVRLLAKLATAVIKAGEPVWYTGDTTNLAPQVERAIDRYVDESHTKTIAVFPLAKRKRADYEKDEDPTRREKAAYPFGALIVEQIESSRVHERMRKRIEIVADHASSAIGNAIELHGIFLMPLWRLIGKSKLLFTASMLPKTIIVTIILAAVVASLILVQWKFQMHCDGTLEPGIRRNIYAPVDAEVKQLFVDHNSKVTGTNNESEGTILLELYSSELESAWMKLLGEYMEILKQIDSLKIQELNVDKKLTDYELTQIRGQLEAANIRLETNKKQQILHKEQMANLIIRSPINGTVVTWDVKRRLSNKRPVSRMQYLMEIADETGEWQLELAMPEKRMGYILEHQKNLRKNDPNAKLRVEFIMATDPNKKYYGTVIENGIHDRAEVRSDTGSAAAASSSLNIVLIKVALDDQDALPASIRPGAECSARVDCGKKPLGYVLLYEVIAFVQKNVLFRWF